MWAAVDFPVLLQVRVALLAESCIQLQLTLKAYVLSKDHLNSLEQWHPAKHVVTEGIAGGEVRQTISCTETGFGDAEGSAELLGGTSDFVFTGTVCLNVAMRHMALFECCQQHAKQAMWAVSTDDCACLSDINCLSGLVLPVFTVPSTVMLGSSSHH